MSDFELDYNISFDSWFEIIEGHEVVNIKRLASAFDKTEDDCIKTLIRNRELFKGDHFEFSGIMSVNSQTGANQKRSRGRPRKEHYLTRNGCLMFVSQLEYQSYEEGTRKFIVAFKRWLTATAGKVLDGQLAPADSGKYIWSEERNTAKSNHKLCMSYVKQFEVPKYPGVNPREIYKRESRAINEDVAGTHISQLSDKMNASGLHAKNEAYVADMALIEAGVDFGTRHPIIKSVLDASYPGRCLCNYLLTDSEKARVKKNLPESQKGLADFTAVVV